MHYKLISGSQRLPHMLRFKHISLLTHFLLALVLQPAYPSFWNLLFLPPILQFLILIHPSQCYQGHCQMPNRRRTEWECQCEECSLPRWVRMKHCYHCGACIHKYDHHCDLLGICIGEFNHKYYALFLICCTVACLSVTLLLFDGLHLQMDPDGRQSVGWIYCVEALSLILAAFACVACGSLSALHLRLLLLNQTTFEVYNRAGAGYLRHIRDSQGSPFNRGRIANLRQTLGAWSGEPIAWTVQVSLFRLSRKL